MHCPLVAAQIGGQVDCDRAGYIEPCVDITCPAAVSGSAIDAVDETVWHIVTAVEVLNSGVILGRISAVKGVIRTGEIPMITDSDYIFRMCCYNVVQRTAGCRTVTSIGVTEILYQHGTGSSTQHCHQHECS